MKGFLIICLLHTTLWVKIVLSLECYICLMPTPSDQCKATKNCSNEDNWCFSTVYGPTEAGFPFRGDRNVIRDCAPKCVPSNPNNLGITRPTYCCQEDLCNAANHAPTMTTTYWASLSIGCLVLVLPQSRG